MFGTILSWLGGGIIGQIGKQLNQAYQAKLTAQTSSERIEADKVITELTAQQAVLVAEQGNWLTRWIRPAFALPFIIYDCKIVVWDKVLEWGSTDPLTPEFWQLQMIVFGAYFVTRPFEKRRK